MTREEAKRRAELYSALADGKTIQVQNPSGGEWFDVKIDTLRSICEETNYRIKPESKYRPFKNQEECWNEMHKHSDFGWIIYDETYHSSCDVDSGGITIIYKCDPYFLAFKPCSEEVTFTDGTPFGVMEEYL